MAEKSSAGKVEPHPLVQALVPDPNQPPQPTVKLLGLPGDSPDASATRVWLDHDLSSYVDVPSEAVLYSKTLPDDAGTVLWVSADAKLSYGSVGSHASQGSYLGGSIVQQNLAGAQASYGVSSQTQTWPTLICSGPPICITQIPPLCAGGVNATHTPPCPTPGTIWSIPPCPVVGLSRMYCTIDGAGCPPPVTVPFAVCPPSRVVVCPVTHTQPCVPVAVSAPQVCPVPVTHDPHTCPPISQPPCTFGTIGCLPPVTLGPLCA
jgi:hypothetical protein